MHIEMRHVKYCAKEMLVNKIVRKSLSFGCTSDKLLIYSKQFKYQFGCWICFRFEDDIFHVRGVRVVVHLLFFFDNR